ncbi:MAG TPA: ribosome small subunit-dependent GTPase A [Acidimicrobiales bacterium]|nr:ribosome small subunit-dependent GTPase A [Acidimicrobiales bacterium]
MEPLADYGWSDRVAALFAAVDGRGAVPGRVARVDRGACTVVTAAGPLRADPACGDEVAATGDWVATVPGEHPGLAAVLPRWSAICRQDPGRATRRQVLAADVDVLAVVAALDRPPSANRLERLLAMAWDSGATPALVLTKADAAPDPAAAVAEAEAVAGGVTVLATSAATGTGVDEIRALLGPATTLAFIGPSGAGKSTLVNRLVGTPVQPTAAVRGTDHRGRHTTTARHLVPVPGGGVLLDTPGLRSLALWDAEAGVAAVFEDVEALAAGCRFGDCRHDGEPACAVRAAVDAGTLGERRLESWAKLRREVESFERRHDEHARRAGERRFGRLVREALELKGRREK